MGRFANMKIKICSLICIISLLFLASPCNSETILYNNLVDPPPYNSYNVNYGWRVGASYVQGELFYSLDTKNLDYIELPLINLFNLSVQVTVTLYSNTSLFDLTVGNPLETWTFTSSSLPRYAYYDSTPYYCNLYRLDSIGHPLLTRGNLYWLVASATGDRFGISWNYASPKEAYEPDEYDGYHYILHGNDMPQYSDTQGQISAMRVVGTTVPEPSILILLCSGLIGIMGIRKRLK
jgi:hypothetical protein